MSESARRRSIESCRSCESRLACVFSEIEGDALARVSAAKITHIYRRGHVLFYEGNPCQAVYCLRSGLAKVYKSTSRDRHHILYLARPGDALGVESLVSAEMHANTAEMLEEGVVCQIESGTLMSVLENYPQVNRRILSLLADQLLTSHDQMTELATGGAKERLAVVLLALAHRFGVEDRTGVQIGVNLSREDLADMIGITPETTIRKLSELRAKHIISTSGRTILILDPERLARIGALGPPVSA